MNGINYFNTLKLTNNFYSASMIVSSIKDCAFIKQGIDSKPFSLAESERTPSKELSNANAECTDIRQLKLFLTGTLDYETQREHKFSLVAESCAKGYFMATTMDNKIPIHISVKDLNEYAPSFNLSSYNLNQDVRFALDNKEYSSPRVKLLIPENLGANTKLYQIQASDKDNTITDPSLNPVSYKGISYALGLTSDPTIRSMFRIGLHDGWLILVRNLDYESGSKNFDLEILAKDDGLPSKTSTLTVEVKVVDINDERPKIIVRALTTSIVDGSAVSSRYSIPLSEDVKNGTFVAKITATDRDTGNGGKVACTLLNNEFSKFAFKDISSDNSNGVSYELVTNSLLDRETSENMILRISCHDFGNVSEHYSNYFRKGNIKLSSEVVITINLLDVNDNPPKFTLDVINASVTENSAPNVLVIQLPFIDQDIDQKNNIFSFLDSVNVSYKEYLKLDPVNGVISTTDVTIDREKTPEFVLNVKVEDKDNSDFFSTSQVIITVVDQNDNDPILIGPKEFVVTEIPNKLFDQSNSREAILIGQLHGQDADLGENGRISFSLAEPNLANNRWLLSQEGILKVLVSSKYLLDREEQDQLYLTILVIDRGLPMPRTSTYTLTIILNDINDNRPIFKSPSDPNEEINIYAPRGIAKDTLELMDGTEPGSIIYQAQAHDSDLHDNGMVTYQLKTQFNEIRSNSKRTSMTKLNDSSLILEDSYFSIDSNSGEIHVLKRLNYEDKDIPKKLTIVARDHGEPVLETTAFLFLKILSPHDSILENHRIYSKNGQITDQQSSNQFLIDKNSNQSIWSSEIIMGLGIGLILLMVACIFILAIVYMFHCNSQKTSSNRTTPNNVGCYAKDKPEIHTASYQAGAPQTILQYYDSANGMYRIAQTQRFEGTEKTELLASSSSEQSAGSSQNPINGVNCSKTVRLPLASKVSSSPEWVTDTFLPSSAFTLAPTAKKQRPVQPDILMYNAQPSTGGNRYAFYSKNNSAPLNNSSEDDQFNIYTTTVTETESQFLNLNKTEGNQKYPDENLIRPPSPGKPQKAHAGYVVGSPYNASSFV